MECLESLVIQLFPPHFNSIHVNMSYVHIEYLIFGTIKVLSVCDMKQHEPAFQRASKSKLDNFVSALLCAVAFMGVPTGHSTTGATFAWAVGSLGQPQFGWVWDSLRAVVNCGHKVLGGCGLKTWNNFCFLAYFFCTRFFFCEEDFPNGQGDFDPTAVSSAVWSRWIRECVGRLERKGAERDIAKLVVVEWGLE